MIILFHDMIKLPRTIDWFLGAVVSRLPLTFDHRIQKFRVAPGQFSDEEVWSPTCDGGITSGYCESERISSLVYPSTDERPVIWTSFTSDNEHPALCSSSSRSLSEAGCYALIQNRFRNEFVIPMEVFNVASTSKES